MIFAVDGDGQAAADVIRLTANDPEWQSFSTPTFLDPLRTLVKKVEAHRTANDFWKSWMVVVCCKKPIIHERLRRISDDS